MAKTFKIGRDAKNGQFIPVSVATRRPSTTVVETNYVIFEKARRN